MLVARRQAPAPSQVRAWFKVALPAAHDGATHSTPAAYSRQAPLPSHTPSVAQLAAPMFLQVPCGSGAPFATGLQVPSDALRPHDWQVPVQPLLQQTPWAQKPDRHSDPSAQVFPSPLRPHDPLMQTAGEAQSALAVQLLLQMAAPHWYGKQDVVAGVRHLPAPSQVDPGVNAVLMAGQVLSLHAVPLA